MSTAHIPPPKGRAPVFRCDAEKLHRRIEYRKIGEERIDVRRRERVERLCTQIVDGSTELPNFLRAVGHDLKWDAYVSENVPLGTWSQFSHFQ